jgi:glutamate---cysteine ligase / carboxylate-amine ligase
MQSYTVGIEEEYFVSHARSFAPATRVPKELARAFLKLKYGNVTTEMMQAQIEVNTGACTTFDQAREQLASLRRMLHQTAGEHHYVISASGTHPMAIWHEQTLTKKARYRRMQDDLQIVGRRNVLCGLHVHVEVPEPERRVTLMLRSLPYLPLLLALSLSSPFWQGHLTGLKGYRLSAYDELPRTGFPPLFSSTQSYDDFIAALTVAKIIPDASHVWWCIRPALSYPTLELRIADSNPRLDDVLCVAAWFRCLIHRLCEDKRFGYVVTAEMLAIISENRWRVQRFGTEASIVDPLTLETTNVANDLKKLADVLGEDADALGCRKEFERWPTVLSEGTAADRQIAIYDEARAAGVSRMGALRQVMSWLVAETAAETNATNGGLSSHQ